MDKIKLFEYLDTQIAEAERKTSLDENEFTLSEYRQAHDNMPETTAKRKLEEMILLGLITKEKRVMLGVLRNIYRFTGDLP